MDESLLGGFGLDPNPAALQKTQKYFEQLKTSENGWKSCVEALLSETYDNSEHIKFFCLQVIEHYLKTKYAAAASSDQQVLRSFLVSYLRKQVSGKSGVVKPYLDNKLSQVFALALVVDYPSRWPTYFRDLLGMLGHDERSVHVYLAILMAIDSEVVDRDIAHTPQEMERNTLIKDTMRVDCIVQLVQSWHNILVTYRTLSPAVLREVLGVIGAYVSWIDIGLIVNDTLVPLLLDCMRDEELRESACDCLSDVVNKGMDPAAKFKLIESLMDLLQAAGVLHVSQDEEAGDEYGAKLGKLINLMGTQLIEVRQKAVKGREAKLAEDAMAGVERKVTLMYTLLAHSDDDISSSVAQFAHDYLGLLKTLPSLSAQQAANVQAMLEATVKKMKYDKSYNFEHEVEDEAEFQEYRKELRTIFSNVGALDSQLLVTTVRDTFAATVTQWQTAQFEDVEVAITLLYMLAEALPSHHGQFFSNDPAKVSLVQQLMELLVTSGVSHHRHRAVTLQYLETVVRYAKFFNSSPHLLPDVLASFLDHRGLRHSSPHVCSRASYLFSRFIREVNKGHLQAYVEEVLGQLGNLLLVRGPDNGVQHQLSPDDQLFVYETAGVLVIQSQLDVEKKSMLIRQLLSSIVTKFDDLYNKMVAAKEVGQQQGYAQALSHAMALASRTSKGFSSQQTMRQSGCVEVYTDVMGIFLRVLQTPVERQPLHAAVRQYLHRMVVCLETEVLPFVPVALEHLLKDPDARELYEFLPLLIQIITKFKKLLVPYLQQVFVPVVMTIFRVLSGPVEANDQVAVMDQTLLRRGYFSFIAALVNNDVIEVLVSQNERDLQQVLMTIVQGAGDIPDPQCQKACFTILRLLVEAWGGKGALPWFDGFIYETIVPACVLSPLRPTFDLRDAQTVLALGEASACVKSVHAMPSSQLATYLPALPALSSHLPSPALQELAGALNMDAKQFKTFFKAFVSQLKS